MHQGEAELSAKEAFDIGWGWFQLHAQQRMQLVSFWFVAMSFLVTATVSAFAADAWELGIVASAAIVGSSLASHLLDLRTQELISYGEELMAQAEVRLVPAGAAESVRLTSGMHAGNRSTVSYRRTFAGLYLGAGVLGVLFPVVALVVNN